MFGLGMIIGALFGMTTAHFIVIRPMIKWYEGRLDYWADNNKKLIECLSRLRDEGDWWKK